MCRHCSARATMRRALLRLCPWVQQCAPSRSARKNLMIAKGNKPPRIEHRKTQWLRVLPKVIPAAGPSHRLFSLVTGRNGAFLPRLAHKTIIRGLDAC